MEVPKDMIDLLIQEWESKDRLSDNEIDMVRVLLRRTGHYNSPSFADINRRLRALLFSWAKLRTIQVT